MPDDTCREGHRITTAALRVSHGEELPCGCPAASSPGRAAAGLGPWVPRLHRGTLAGEWFAAVTERDDDCKVLVDDTRLQHVIALTAAGVRRFVRRVRLLDTAYYEPKGLNGDH